MRFFEIAISLALILLPLFILIFPKMWSVRARSVSLYLGAGLLLLLFFQNELEHLRWQMMPLALLAILWSYTLLRNDKIGKDAAVNAFWAKWVTGILTLAFLLLALALHAPWWVFPLGALGLIWCYAKLRTPLVHPLPSRGWAWLGLILGVVFLAPPILLPVPQLPQPSGPYAVGTTTFYWQDPSRPELYSDDPNDTRRLMVQVWYPADPQSGAHLAPYLNNAEIALPALAKKFHVAPFLLNHLELAVTHSLQDAPVAHPIDPSYLTYLHNPNLFPVLIFSHGWTGMRTQNTFQMEELASQGYIVFAPDHTYGAMFTLFPDGEVVMNKRDALGSEELSDAEYDRIARILGQTWVGDLRFVLDQAEKLNSGEIPSLLAGRLDLSRVGMFGHSTGGGAVVEACASDARCKAGLTMDAWLIPYDRALLTNGPDKPFFFMQSELWSMPRNPQMQQQLYLAMRAPAYRLTLLQAKHYDFSDIPLITPLAPLIGLKGPIPAARSLTLINQFSVAFFEQYLKGISSPVLKDASGIVEIRLEFRE